MSVKKNKENIDILIVTDNGLETVGGEQESTKIIIDGVKNLHSLGVIQPGKITKPIQGVKYYNLTDKTRIKHFIKNPFYFMKYIMGIRKIIKRENPKVIHTQAQVSFFIVSLLKTLKLIPKHNKIIHTERGLYIRYNPFFKKMFLFFMKKLDVLVTTTNYNMKFWKSALEEKCPDLEYRVIENTAGTLFETYDTRKENRQKDAITIGFAGRFSEQKNWPLAVEISKQLKETLGDAVYVKMAVGCLDEESQKETLKMFNKLEDILGDKFEGKINIDIEEMNNFYYSIDVFIMTSLKDSESFGRTLVEAMSRKVIVLTTDAGGPVEIVRNRENVLSNTQEFSERIFMMYNNPIKSMSEKEKNMKIVKENYSLSNNKQKHLNLYSSFLL